MSTKLARIAGDRQRLTAQAEVQRLALGRAIEPWEIVLKRAEQGWAVMRYIKSHPGSLAGGLAVVAALRPWRTGKWLGRGLVLWQVLQGLRAVMDSAPPHARGRRLRRRGRKIST